MKRIFIGVGLSVKVVNSQDRRCFVTLYSCQDSPKQKNKQKTVKARSYLKGCDRLLLKIDSEVPEMTGIKILVRQTLMNP